MIRFLSSLFIISVLLACNQEPEKNATTDLKEEAIDLEKLNDNKIESQFYEINTDSDTIIEGKNGTILQIPKNAFVDRDGNNIQGNLQIELKEPESIDEYILSGITSQSDNGLLESKHTFKIAAFQNGEPLKIKEGSNIYTELPIERGGGEIIDFFYGKRGEDGSLSWQEIQDAQRKFLIPIEMNLLNYLPEGFKNEVEAGMPFRSHKKTSNALVDSLYYSLFLDERTPEPRFELEESDAPLLDALADTTVDGPLRYLKPNCGVDPATIKSIRTEEFQGTLLTTREFEERLQVIFKTCNNAILELYIENQQLDLWQIDSMAAELVGKSNEHYTTFRKYSEERLTNVENSPSSEKLSKFYANRLEKVQKKLKQLKDKAQKEYQKKNELAAEKRKEYIELLKKREKYRMNKFGFKLNEFGWYNGAVYVHQLKKFVLEVTVNNGDQYDRVHTYIVNNRINSLFSMLSNDQVNFLWGHHADMHLLMWDEQLADAIVIAYSSDSIFFEKQEFRVSTEVPAILKFNLMQISERELRKNLRSDFWRSKENKIKVDLEYQLQFEKERQRQKRLKDERIFIDKLKEKAFPCCIEEYGNSNLQ